MPIISVERLKSFEVFDRQGEKIGSVRDVLVDLDDGRVQYALVGASGFLAALGLQDKLFAIPCDALTVGDNRLTLNIDSEQLRDAPAFSPGELPEFTREYETTLLRFYGMTPYWDRPSYRLAEREAGEFLTRDVLTVHPNTPIGEVAGVLARTGNAAVPVVDEQGRFAGMIMASELAGLAAGGQTPRGMQQHAQDSGQPKHIVEERTPAEEMVEPTGMANLRTAEEMPLRPEAARYEPGTYEEEHGSWELPPERRSPMQRQQSPSHEHEVRGGDRGDEDVRRSA